MKVQAPPGSPAHSSPIPASPQQMVVAPPIHTWGSMVMGIHTSTICEAVTVQPPAAQTGPQIARADDANSPPFTHTLTGPTGYGQVSSKQNQPTLSVASSTLPTAKSNFKPEHPVSGSVSGGIMSSTLSPIITVWDTPPIVTWTLVI